ncbi:D-tyrosyl-tRNA(Tyr) deacylase [Gaertneriomyces sp. JEL0708]|nr:D-tyrosyl-tRNA(Tyr) deacylase [Gaertneriomyces sp. JEL0708]
MPVVNEKIVGKIGKGIAVLVGLNVEDQEKDLDYIVNKLVNIRVFEDDEGRMWRKSVRDLSLEILSVSQFTLFGKVDKGSKPDFHLAMKSDQSKAMYELFLQKLGKAYEAHKIQDGVFGAMMQVNIVNEGPVTLIIDSRAKNQKEPATH